MIAAEFYRRAEGILQPHLSARGWERIERAFLVKREGDGVDRLALDPAKTFRQFAVLVSFEPNDVVALVRELFGGESSEADRGFLCGPYLTAAGVSRLRRQWKCDTRSALEKSMGQVTCA